MTTYAWERKCAHAVLKARTIARKEIDRLMDRGLSKDDGAMKVARLDAIVELLTEALHSIDPEVQRTWDD